jgi:hypothetical protein
MWNRRLIGPLVLGLAAIGCEVELDECGKLHTKSKCEGAATPEAANGGCFWLQVYEPTIADGQCDLGEPHGECIGIDGTQQGCYGGDCAGPTIRNAFFRRDEDERLELFVNPECGPTPVGEWLSCSESEAECACACELPP